MTTERRASLIVLAVYGILTAGMTWPLLAGLARDVPGDLGDSLLNMWILGWGADMVPRVLTGRAALQEYWNANIFHPEPLALGFSEHLFGLVLQILPVYWISGNLILCYNLLFLSSFALSGLAMFLLVRDLLSASVARSGRDPDGRAVLAAAFLAGLIFAFLPFRIAQVAHIQSLQAQWMPFALYGFHRFIVARRRRALAGGTAALLMQHWSNGYYMIFFAPFVPVFVLHQMWTAGRLRDTRMWLAFGVAAAIVAAGTWPFLLLYLETQRVHAFERPLGEVIRFSADVYSYLTAPELLRLWGSVMRADPKPEGELFFGVLPWLLAAVALVMGARSHAGRGEAGDVAPARRGALERGITWVLVALLIVQTAGVIAIVFTGGFISSFGGLPIRATNPIRILMGIALASVALLVVSRATRRRLAAALRSPLLLCALLTLAALWLSLGPLPQSGGRPLAGLGLYRLLYEHVPGFDGLRVPARYAMVAAVFLCVVCGFGAYRLFAARRAVTMACALSAVFLIEAAFAPLPVNLTWSDREALPARVAPAADAPAVYHTLAAMPPTTVVAEFPFGDPEWELRYVYYATVHKQRLLNGYSGGFPLGYKTRVATLQRIDRDPDAAWRALRAAGTTHVVIHQHAMTAADAAATVKWLEDRFAVEIARFDGDLLYDVTGVWRPVLEP